MSTAGYAFAAWVGTVVGSLLWIAWAWWPLDADTSEAPIPSLLQLPRLRYWALALPAWATVAFFYTR